MMRLHDRRILLALAAFACLAPLGFATVGGFVQDTATIASLLALAALRQRRRLLP